MSQYLFPADFIWGATTSSYQVEGSPETDGKGRSIWDRLARSEGNILDHATGDIACDLAGYAFVVTKNDILTGE